jgi:hypothetical protein
MSESVVSPPVPAEEAARAERERPTGTEEVVVLDYGGQ